MTLLSGESILTVNTSYVSESRASAKLLLTALLALPAPAAKEHNCSLHTIIMFDDGRTFPMMTDKIFSIAQESGLASAGFPLRYTSENITNLFELREEFIDKYVNDVIAAQTAEQSLPAASSIPRPKPN